jgi:hypothetical protein
MEVEPQVRQSTTMLMVVPLAVWRNKVLMLIHTQELKVREERLTLARQEEMEFMDTGMEREVVEAVVVGLERILPTTIL